MMKTSVLVFAAAGGVLGYYALSRFPFAAIACLTVLAAAAVFCALNRKFRRSGLPAAAALAAGLVLGFVNASEAVKPLSRGLPYETISALKGTLLDDPRTLARSGMARLDLGAAVSNALPGTSGSVRAGASGTVLVFFPPDAMPRLKQFGRGGEVYIEGNFSGFPQTGDPQAGRAGQKYDMPVFRARSVHLVTPASALEQFRTGIRLSLLDRLNGLDGSGLAAALLLGNRENLDGDLARSYRDAGLSHILALSGMHLAFLSALLAFFLKRPLGKKGAVLAGLCFIIVYVFVVGPQPSLLRAALMYGMGALVILAGVPGITSVFLCAAFLLQTTVDPQSGFSASFTLSYGALAGILLLSEKIAFLLRGRVPHALAQALSASAGAFVATAPLVIALFGVLRPVGIAAGLAAVPLTSLFMALSLAALVLGGFVPAADIFGKALAILGNCIGRLVSAAAAFPGLQAPFAPALAVSVFLAVLILFAEYRLRRYRNRFAPFV
jgi:competence protein ComEC